ncbi:MAG: RNA polymerase sigma factor SigJ [Chloroflexi bacterium]|nr:RNA polymerase sigma factor SigJ [Chloroflexota bacterium]MDA1146507.1 RNA polymerase sigma factor SigJ [Chloroflexota bacterium]
MTTTGIDRRTEVFAEQRPYLFAVAYRLLASAEDADDALQDAWLRFAAVDLESIESPRAYLVTIVTRLCLDVLRSARRRREEYVGTWLPEPVPSDAVLPEEVVERAESASFAFMLLLERLNPVERAVLVLHDVFDYSHDEVGEAIGRSAPASRQALRRARKRLGGIDRAPRRPSAHGRELVARFFEATQSGDIDGLVSALAKDVVLLSDGGGQARSANRPLAGRGLVSRFWTAMAQLPGGPVRVELVDLNGQPSALTYEGDVLTNAILFDVGAAGVTSIYVVRNPAKLLRIAAAGDASVPPTLDEERAAKAAANESQRE